MKRSTREWVKKAEEDYVVANHASLWTGRLSLPPKLLCSGMWNELPVVSPEFLLCQIHQFRSRKMRMRHGRSTSMSRSHITWSPRHKCRRSPSGTSCGAVGSLMAMGCEERMGRAVFAI